MSFEKDTGRDAYFAQLEKELAELIDPATGLLSADCARAVPCPLCRGGTHDRVFVKRGYTFVRCRDCSFVFANPQVVPELVEKIYRRDPLSLELWHRVLLNETETKWRRAYFEGVLEKINAAVPRGRLLDVGCAVGHFLTVARDAGWDVAGLELSPLGVKHCRDELGLDVRQQMLAEATFPAGSFDAVTLLGVLEHVADPLGLFREVFDAVRPGGAVAVVVPNVESLLCMFLREKNVSFDGRNHLVYFSMRTLKRCFEEAGFEVASGDTVLTGFDNILRYAQFSDPYAGECGSDFIPEEARPLAAKENRAAVETWILRHGLGLRLRMVGRKPA